jgi:thiamine monophosphate synthase
MTSTPLHPAELLAWLSASCQRQDLPLIINDPATISQVAVLLGVHTRAPSKHPKRHPPTHNAPRIDTTTHPMAA